ncbi:hypothetical protein HYT53_03335 [Candidatus Woesearchaeota archaeon]|nr:hypothetical protein [Candidatus Woesearchaeota archaeon]
MKYAHLVKLTAFSHEGEDSESIRDAFLRFFPFSLEENKVILNKTAAEGFHGRKIAVFGAKLAKNSLISRFLENLLSNLDEIQKQKTLMQLDSRLDENLDFFLRFDKDSWIEENKLVLTDSGKCFHLKISIAAFPKKREAALNVIMDLFGKVKT